MIRIFLGLALVYVCGCLVFASTYYVLNLFVNFIFTVFGLSYAEWALKTLPIWSQKLNGALAAAVALYVCYRLLKKLYAYWKSLPPPIPKPTPPVPKPPESELTEEERRESDDDIVALWLLSRND